MCMPSVIRLPAYRERGPVEIRFDSDRIEAVPSLFLHRGTPAYDFRLRANKHVLATVPYEDRDAIFSYDGELQFDTYTLRDGSSVHQISVGSLWHRSPLQIKFCPPIPVC
jgi:hypothetical protein